MEKNKSKKEEKKGKERNKEKKKKGTQSIAIPICRLIWLTRKKEISHCQPFFPFFFLRFFFLCKENVSNNITINIFTDIFLSFLFFSSFQNL